MGLHVPPLDRRKFPRRQGEWGPHRGSRSAHARARDSAGHTPQGPDPTPRVSCRGDGCRRRRGRGRQGDVSFAARPVPAPRRPGPLAVAANTGPRQVSYLQPEKREGEREGSSRCRRCGTGRGAGRASAEKTPSSTCRRRDPDAARPVCRPLRPLAGCVRACGVVALSA